MKMYFKTRSQARTMAKATNKKVIDQGNTNKKRWAISIK